MEMQVTVRTTPWRGCTSSVINRPIALTSSTSTLAMMSYGPLTGHLR